MKRIAILHYTAPPVVGGVEITIYHHARLLSKKGYQVMVIAGNKGETFPGVEFQQIEEINSRHKLVLEVGRQLAQGKISNDFYSLRGRLIESLGTLFNRVDVCIVHNVMTLHKNIVLTAALKHLAENGTTRLIAWSHDFAWQDTLYQPVLHPGYPWDLLRTPWKGVKYVVVSAHRRKRLAELFAIDEEQITVVNPGVDVVEILKLEPLTKDIVQKLDLLEAHPIFLLPARITRRKNIEFAIQIISALKSEYPKVACVVTGPPGPHNPTNVAYLEELNRLKRGLGVDNHVHFIYELAGSGETLWIPDKVVSDLYHLSDLLLFPSRKEGFGIPVLEAGLLRLPVFAADIPPIRESVGVYANLFKLSSTATEVANMIIESLEKNNAYRMRQHIRQHYTWQSLVDKKLIPLIEEGI